MTSTPPPQILESTLGINSPSYTQQIKSNPIKKNQLKSDRSNLIIMGEKDCLKVGPWGGKGGYNFDDGSYNGVKEIIIVYSKQINSIRFVYDKRKRSILSNHHGGNGGDHTVQIVLKFPEEYLTEISGYHSYIANYPTPVIRSLAFKTNLRSLGPFGIEEGLEFVLPTNGAMVVGFNGRSGRYLDSIGCTLSPKNNGPTMLNRLNNKLQKKIEEYANRTTTNNQNSLQKAH